MALWYLLAECKNSHWIHTYNNRRRDLLRLTLAKTSK